MDTHKEDCLEDEDQLDDSELGFEEMGLDPRLLRAISKKGLSKPTPIQLKAIPLILEGKDVVARAKTGSGKTLAYLLPLLQKNFSVSCQGATASGPRALILVPTRELCQQVYAEVKSLLEYCGGTWKAVQLISSMSVSSLRAALAGPPDIVVTTPACCAKCLSEEIIRVTSLKESLSTLVLDEADLLLSYGYEEDIRNFARHIPRRCQCLLMSATSSADVEKLKKLVLHNPVTLTLKDLDGNVENKIVPETVQQFWISCKAEDKLLNLLALLHLELVQTKALVFVNTIDSGFRVKLFLEQFGVKSAVLNAELPQNSRLHILQEFNIGLFDYLIATDDGTSVNENDLHTEKAVKDKGIDGTKGRCLKWNGKKMPIDSEFGVTRGIDFKNVRTVINFDMPGTPANYVHRIGRTGRAQCTGASISLVSLEEEKLLKDVEELLGGGNVVESGPQKAITPFPSITNESIESLRYRGEDVARGVTKAAVREARAKELRMEILNSERLKAHFEDHPKDLEMLKHDKVLSKKRPLPHLRTVPEYLRDPTTEAASRAVKLARAAMEHASSGFKSRQRKKRFRTDDPLKNFSVKSKKRKEKSGEPNSTLWARNKGERKRSSSSGKHVQHQRKHRRHK